MRQMTNSAGKPPVNKTTKWSFSLISFEWSWKWLLLLLLIPGVWVVFIIARALRVYKADPGFKEAGVTKTDFAIGAVRAQLPTKPKAGDCGCDAPAAEPTGRVDETQPVQAPIAAVPLGEKVDVEVQYEKPLPELPPSNYTQARNTR